jgi:L-2-hydroxycarboxylate dehydrogenase (NAD+)
MFTTLSYNTISEFVTRVFRISGCSETDAATATSVLISADLRGVDSHGVARLVNYLRLQQIGRISFSPNIKLTYETPSTATIDADGGLGLFVAPRAMEVAIAKAQSAGTGWVSVQNSSHFGIAGYHAMLALPHNMIGIAMTNASALVTPALGAERMLGTNPIAVAIPAKNQPPFVADFATSAMSNGKLELMQQKQTKAPKGVAIDKDGRETDDPSTLKQGGMLLPLGSDIIHGSHKGYALGSIVDIFSAVLGGASYGPWAPPFPPYVPLPADMPGKGLGHFFGAMRIDAFRPAEDFLTNMDRWIERFRSSKPAPGEHQVLIPGDPERAYEAERMVSGIPIHNDVYQQLVTIAAELGIDFQ